MNKSVLKIFRKANRILKQQSQVNELLRKAAQKLQKLKGSNKQINELIEYVQLFLKMIKKSFIGEYNSFSNKTLLSLVFGLLYFVTPMDLVPDFIPLLGFSDDLSIIYFIVKNFKSDIEAFKIWELNQRSMS
ncbi:MAG: hypothetical protein CMB82_06970 [Flammeovirgaceae bacterium]|nr:hypothetical protein [Flammeovirgaceae bacterium]|tara:strand:- start:511 stop:906 length:396 start_codon:yes stop_codon:yes gene_type:complete